jgi:two-component system sensor histidine kinase DegS
MSRALLDQLTIWQEWAQSRLREVEAERGVAEAATSDTLQGIARQAPQYAQALDRLEALSRALGRLDGQREVLEETTGNLDFFVEMRETGEGSGEDLDFVTQTILDAQEEERHRTSIRIHDGPAQSLANVMMRLEFCEKLSLKDAQRASTEIRDVRRELDAVLADVRRLIFELRPMTLDDLGLIATLQRFAENERERLPCDVQVSVKGRYQRFARSAETHIYRIIQEGVGNAAQHAHPFHILIQLAIGADKVILSIGDDGAGFDVATTPLGTGMFEVRRRVRALDGAVSWVSEVGKGCRLTVEVPMKRLEKV